MLCRLLHLHRPGHRHLGDAAVLRSRRLLPFQRANVENQAAGAERGARRTMIGSPPQPAVGGRRRLWIALAVAFVVVAGLVAGLGWAAWWVYDNVGAPGPGATGSGPCSSADAVNLQLVFADGHTTQICTRDRPSCPNQTNPNANMNATSVFNMSNQLRSSSRRYILFMR